MKIEINASDELVIKSLRPISDAVFYDKGRILAVITEALNSGVSKASICRTFGVNAPPFMMRSRELRRVTDINSFLAYSYG